MPGMTGLAWLMCLGCDAEVWAEVRKTPDRITWYCPKCGAELDSDYIDYDYYGTDYEP